MDIEKWRPVRDFEGLYEVSSLGRVRSLDKLRSSGLPLRGRLMSVKPRRDGYVPVTLWRAGQRSVRLVHRVVLDAFVGPRPGRADAMHADGVRNNNALSNLSWGTRSENIYDQVRHGTQYHAAKNACKRGHPFTDENTYNYPNSQHRACRTCRRDWLRKSREKHSLEKEEAA